MENKNTPVLGIIITILVVCGLVFWAVRGVRLVKNPLTSASATPTPAPKVSIQREDLDPKLLPANFPRTIPLEVGAKVIANYSLKMPDGDSQFARTFVTVKTLDANFTLYNDFFKQDGWKIGATLNQPTYKVIAASKDNLKVQVSIFEDPTTKVKTVTISVIGVGK